MVPQLTRYNSLPSMNLQGNAAPGLSSGDAMTAMEEMVGQLPEGISYEWTGLSLEEQKSGSQAPLLYALSILVVFLCLAALYELDGSRCRVARHSAWRTWGSVVYLATPVCQ